MRPTSGAMLWFHEVKGYGFIRTDAGDRVLVERDSFVGGLAPVGRCAGLPVQLRVEERDGTDVAVDVCVVQEEPSRRARRRSSGMRASGL